MSARLSAAVAALVYFVALPSQAALSLDQIMAEPDWIGAAVESPYWSTDGAAVYYALKREGSPVRDLHRIAVADGADRTLDAAELAGIDGKDAVFDQARRRAAFIRNGDVFVRDLASQRLIQVTRTTAEESAPQFSADQNSCLLYTSPSPRDS